MSQLNDISLIAQVVMFHNNRAFDQLVRKYQSPVRRFFLNLTCGDSELSDDLAQDTFIRAWSGLPCSGSRASSAVSMPISSP